MPDPSTPHKALPAASDAPKNLPSPPSSRQASNRMTFRRPKRRVVALDSGWAVVTHSPRRMRSEAALENDAEGGSDATPAPPKEGVTLESLVGEVERYRRRWRESGAASELVRDVVGGLEREGRRARIDKGVALGTGSFSSERGDRTRSVWQLVAFVEVGDALSTSTCSLPLFAQDPRFNSLDVELLRSLNITSTTTASEEGYITPATFIYSPYLPWEVLLPTFLARADPVLFIGNDIEDTIKLIELLGNEVEEEKTASHMKVGEKFLKERNGKRVGDLSHLNALAFAGLMIYWKPKEVEG